MLLYCLYFAGVWHTEAKKEKKKGHSWANTCFTLLKVLFGFATTRRGALPFYIIMLTLQPFEKYKQALEQHRKVLKIAFIYTDLQIM